MTSEMPALPGDERNTDERTALLSMLEYQRVVLLRKTYGLTDAQLASMFPPSDMTLGGLLFHMALVEDTWFHIRLAEGGVPEPWESIDWSSDPDWEFHNASELSHEQLVAQFTASVGRSCSVMDTVESLDQIAVRGEQGNSDTNVRWILVHMIEEYARHCGHADLIREAIDGSTGD